MPKHEDPLRKQSRSTDPTRIDDLIDEDDEELALMYPEGREGYSWQRLSSDGNENEGWGREGGNADGKRRRRQAEGD